MWHNGGSNVRRVSSQPQAAAAAAAMTQIVAFVLLYAAAVSY